MKGAMAMVGPRAADFPYAARRASIISYAPHACAPNVDARVPLLTQAAVVFFAISIALENTASRVLPLPTSLPTIAALVLAAAYLLFFPRRRNVATASAGLRFFYFFAVLTSLGELFRWAGSRDSLSAFHLATFLMYLKLMFAFYILNRMVSNNPRLYRLLVFSWIYTLLILALLAIFRIDLFSYEYHGRVGLVGENLNIAGHRWAGAAVGMAAFLMCKQRLFSRANLGALLLTVIFLLAAFQSGSKGASVAILFGLAIFLATGSGLKLKKIAKFALLGVMFAWIIYRAFIATDIIRNRWSTVVEDGNLGLRERLLTGSVELIKREPVFGYGSTYDILLGAQLGRRPIVSHNTVTQVLLTTGVIGFVPFILALVLAFKRGLLHATTPIGAAVFAVFITALVSSNFGNWAHLKYFWLILILVFNTSPQPSCFLPAAARKFRMPQLSGIRSRKSWRRTAPKDAPPPVVV